MPDTPDPHSTAPASLRPLDMGPALSRAVGGVGNMGAATAAQFEEYSRLAAEAAEARSALGLVRRILSRFREFEATLDAQQEVGIRLVSFGQTVTFHVAKLACIEPSLIVFIGRTDEGLPVQLVQHMSQVSFLLMVLPRLSPEEPRKPIGFEVGAS